MEPVSIASALVQIVLTSEGNIIVMLESVNGINLSSNIKLLGGLVEIFDCWMFWVAAKDLLCLLRPVAKSARAPAFVITTTTYLSGR